MKLEITLKDPNGFDQAVKDYIDLGDSLPESEYEAREDAILRLSKWFES